MDDKITTTATLVLIFGSLTVGNGFGNTYKADYTVPQKPITYSEIIDTKIQIDDYIGEKYTVNEYIADSGIYSHLDFFNFIQKVEFQQKEIDEDILTAINEFEKLTSKRIPTKSRC